VKKNLKKIGLLLTLAFSFSLNVWASSENPTVDELFEQARKLAFSGNKEQARKLCLTALERSPGYMDIRIFLGRLYSWDSLYDQGRKELDRVLTEDPANADARLALVDLEIWADNPMKAVNVCDEGLAKNPKNRDLLYKKARALRNAGNKEAAIIAVHKLLELYPKDPEGLSLLDDIKGIGITEGILLDYSHDIFDKSFDPWNELTLQYRHRFGFGSVLGRINYASRFDETAAQVEVDAYPHIREGTYAYLNVGYSHSSIFPNFSCGGEIYQNLGKAWEASLGFRYLKFSSDVVILTGIIGKYIGNYYFSLRPYVTPSSIGSSVSGTLLIRRYFGGEDYMTLQVGAGASPDQVASTLQIYQAEDGHARLDWYVELFKNFFGSGYIAVDRQEFYPGDYRFQFTFDIGIEQRF